MTNATSAYLDASSPPPGPSVPERVAFDRVATIYAQSPQPLWAAAAYALMIGVAMWERAPQVTVLAWVLVRVAVSLVRIHETRLFNRDPLRMRRIAHWRARYMSLMVLEGASWSAMAIVFLPHAHGMTATWILASGIGIAALSVFTLTSHFPSAVVNLVTNLVPTAAYLGLAAQSDGWLIAGGVVVYMGVLINEAWQSDRRWSEMARMRYETADLAAQREVARRAAEESSNAKSAFLANMSHEIRTPLNGMIGLTELLLQDTLSAQQRHYLELSRNSSAHLLRLVDEVLDLSKIRAAGMTLERTEFSLHELVDELLPVFSARAAGKGLPLYSQICPQLPAHVLGDPMRLRQVLSNLVGNAVKFTAAGHVLLRVHAVPGCTGAGGTRVHFEVCDTGPGIPADKRDLVFQAFAQADTSTARQHGGTGLGLTISASLLELMGSKLLLDSAPGGGCCFHFEIDFAPAQADPGRGAAVLRDWPGQRALWIDPQPITRQWHAAVLRQWGIAVDEAEGIEQGLARLSAAASGYDAVFVCSSLLSAERAACWNELLAATAGMRLVVMSSPGHSLPAELRTDAPQLLLLMAPLSLRKLNAAFSAAAGAAHEAPPPETDTAACARRTVLLVEDNDVNALIATEVLRRAGARVVRAAAGEEALAAFSAQAFDLVLMDLQMPGMDGFEATRRIRAWERAQPRQRQAVPIVALTANALPSDAADCLACGMNDYLTKPIRPDQLVRLLRATPELAAAGERAGTRCAPHRAIEPMPLAVG